MKKQEVIPGETLIEWKYFEGEFDKEMNLIATRGTELTIEELNEFSVAESLLFITFEGLRHLLPWFIEAIEVCLSTDKSIRIAEIAIRVLSVPAVEDSSVARAEADELAGWLVEATNYLSQEDCFVVCKTLDRLIEHMRNDNHDFEFVYTYMVYGIDEERTLAIWKRASER